MKVIHDEPNSFSQPFSPQQPISLNNDIEYLERLRLEELRKRTTQPQTPLIETPRPAPQPSLSDETITKRNAAMMLLTYLGQKKQAILISIMGAVGVFIVTAFVGWIGGILAVVAVCIWFGSQYLSNEKEVKALKERFVI